MRLLRAPNGENFAVARLLSERSDLEVLRGLDTLPLDYLIG